MKRVIPFASPATALAAVLLCLPHSAAMAQAPGPTAALNPQKTEVILGFPSSASGKVTLDAAEVDRLIGTLAQSRAAMNPPRPMAEPAPGSTLNVATTGRWLVQPDGTGVDLAVLHPGYGWVGVELDRNSVEQLNRTLVRSLHPAVTRARHPARRE